MENLASIILLVLEIFLFVLLGFFLVADSLGIVLNLAKNAHTWHQVHHMSSLSYQIFKLWLAFFLTNSASFSENI